MRSRLQRALCLGLLALAVLATAACGSGPAPVAADSGASVDGAVADSPPGPAENDAADDSGGDSAASDDPVDDTAGAAEDATLEPAITVVASTASVLWFEDAAWTSNVTVTANGDGTWRLQSDGVPSHEIDALIGLPKNPNNISESRARVRLNPTAPQNYDVTLPLEPTWSEAVTPTSSGVIGIMVSGAALYNPYEAGGGVALDTNFEIDGAAFIDACNGHADRTGVYHYHGVPYCITDAVDSPGSHSVMIGVLLDGYPIYGPQDAGGLAPTDLDVCKGHVGPTPEFPEGVYHYHLLESGTYSIDCYHGIAQTVSADPEPSQDPTGAAPGGGAAPVDPPRNGPDRPAQPTRPRDDSDSADANQPEATGAERNGEDRDDVERPEPEQPVEARIDADRPVPEVPAADRAERPPRRDDEDRESREPSNPPEEPEEPQRPRDRDDGEDRDSSDRESSDRDSSERDDDPEARD